MVTVSTTEERRNRIQGDKEKMKHHSVNALRGNEISRTVSNSNKLQEELGVRGAERFYSNLTINVGSLCPSNSTFAPSSPLSRSTINITLTLILFSRLELRASSLPSVETFIRSIGNIAKAHAQR